MAQQSLWSQLTPLPPGEEWAVSCGEAASVLAGMPENCIDAIVTDPPSGKGFMGVSWDTFALPKGAGASPEVWDRTGSDAHARDGAETHRVTQRQRQAFCAAMLPIFRECLRVLKPGHYGLVWAFPHTAHWTALALEDAGFLIVHQVAHLQAQGFPKQGRLDKMIDKAGGYARVRSGDYQRPDGSAARQGTKQRDLYDSGMRGAAYDGGQTLPASTEAQRVAGRGGLLKPQHECWLLVQKPYERIAAEELHRLTGWEHWHIRRPVRNAEEQARYCQAGFRPLPSGGCPHATTPGVPFVVDQRTALHPGATTQTVLLHGDGETVLDERPYRAWRLCNAAANAIKWGGGLRIDASRIPVHGHREGRIAIGTGLEHRVTEIRGSSVTTPPTGLGRYPGDVILSHAPGCVRRGYARVRGSAPVTGDEPSPMARLTYHDMQHRSPSCFVDADGTELVEIWDCVDGCVVATLNDAGGLRTSRRYVPGGPGGTQAIWEKGLQQRDATRGYADTGHLSRYFLTVSEDGPSIDLPPVYAPKIAPSARWAWCETCRCVVAPDAIAEHAGHDLAYHITQKPSRLMETLVQLLAEPGELVLDPFCGTGTTGVACRRMDVRFVGIEQDPRWAAVSRARLAAPMVPIGTFSEEADAG